MKQTLIAALIVAVTAALAAAVSVATASGGSKPLPSAARLHVDRSVEPLSFKPDPAMERGAAERIRGRGLRIAYLVSPTVPVGPYQSLSFRGACPGGGSPIDGGFASDGGIVADLIAPSGIRTYDYRVFDITGVSGTVTFTLTCLK